MDALRETAETEYHQYTRPAGHPPLVKLLASRYSLHLNRQVDPFDEIAVTVGASQALYLALRTFIKAGEEIVLFEPFFDVIQYNFSLYNNFQSVLFYNFSFT